MNSHYSSPAQEPHEHVELLMEPPIIPSGVTQEVSQGVGFDSVSLETKVNAVFVEHDEQEQKSRLVTMMEWARNRKIAIGIGALTVASSGVTAATSDLEQIKDSVFDSAPWIGAGIVAAEVTWVAGGAAMLVAAGIKVKNILSVRKQVQQLNSNAQLESANSDTHLTENGLFRAGFAVNAVGAVGTAATFTVAVVETLPPQSWGVLALGAVDLAQTVGTRIAVWGALRPVKSTSRSGTMIPTARHRATGEGNDLLVKNLLSREILMHSADDTASSDNVIDVWPALVNTQAVEQKEASGEGASIRSAVEADIEQIVDLDLKMFRKAYGDKLPSRDEVKEMMTRRLQNLGQGGWMHICVVDGKVEGFITAFLTDKPQERFRSWEDSTNNGTLDGVVRPDGKYVYVANLTVAPQASRHKGRERLMANVFASAIGTTDAEYGYFESRIPRFSRWLNRQDINPSELDTATLDAYAQEYVNLTRTVGGKNVAVDPQVRMYESAGMHRGVLVPDAFKDPESLDYGIVFKAPIPQVPKPFKRLAKSALEIVAKSPKIAAKIF